MKIISKRGKEKRSVETGFPTDWNGGYTKDEVNELNRHMHQVEAEDACVAQLLYELEDSLKDFAQEPHDALWSMKVRVHLNSILMRLKEKRSVEDFKVESWTYLCPHTFLPLVGIRIHINAFGRFYTRHLNLK